MVVFCDINESATVHLANATVKDLKQTKIRHECKSHSEPPFTLSTRENLQDGSHWKFRLLSGTGGKPLSLLSIMRSVINTSCI
jgi:hypothetical protein